jgi:hypothetical protein
MIQRQNVEVKNAVGTERQRPKLEIIYAKWDITLKRKTPNRTKGRREKTWRGRKWQKGNTSIGKNIKREKPDGEKCQKEKSVDWN